MPTRHLLPDTVPFVAGTTWVKAAVSCGFNIEPLLREAGVADALGSDLMPPIRPQALLDLMRACTAAAAPAHYFPLVAGELFAFEHLPALETFLATSSTPRQALSALGWVSTALPLLSLRLEEDGGPDAPGSAALVVVFGDAQIAPEAVALNVEMALAGIHKFARLLLGGVPPGCSVQLRHDPGEHRALFERTFGLPVQVAQPRNAALFPRHLLDLPLRGALPALHQRAQALVQRELPPDAESDLIASMEYRLMREPALLGQPLSQMAARLALHPRTLQRRLTEAGLSYSELRARCRRRLAEQDLSESAVDIEVLSERLGFSDRHSFTRAFKRWTGLSPSEWRRRARGS